MSVEDYAIDELFDVGPKSVSVSTLGSAIPLTQTFQIGPRSNPWQRHQRTALAKSDTDDTKQARGDIRPIPSACRTRLQNETSERCEIRIGPEPQRRSHMRTLFGIAIIAVALLVNTWSVEPTVGKTPTVSVDPLVLMATTTNLSQAHYKDYSTIY